MKLGQSIGDCSMCPKTETMIVKKIAGRGYCVECNRVRLDLRNIEYAGQGVIIPQGKKKYVITFKKPTGEKRMFDEIWEEREEDDGGHKSYISGLSVDQHHGTKFYPNLFAHVLAKGLNKYPKFKLYKPNIMLLTPGEHRLLDHGSEEQRINYELKMSQQGVTVDWQKLYDLQDQLKEEYKLKYGKK